MSQPFKKKWLWRDGRERDRFQVEFNKDERDEFVNMQLFLEQSKDATALKQMAAIGWAAISNQQEFFTLLKQTLLKNDRNNKRLGVVPEIEIKDKFQRKNTEMGGNL
jgi:hypothetical protein